MNLNASELEMGGVFFFFLFWHPVGGLVCEYMTDAESEEEKSDAEQITL